jgi:hypothetical protein
VNNLATRLRFDRLTPLNTDTKFKSAFLHKRKTFLTKWRAARRKGQQIFNECVDAGKVKFGSTN